MQWHEVTAAGEQPPRLSAHSLTCISERICVSHEREAASAILQQRTPPGEGAPVASDRLEDFDALSGMSDQSPTTPVGGGGASAAASAQSLHGVTRTHRFVLFGGYSLDSASFSSKVFLLTVQEVWLCVAHKGLQLTLSQQVVGQVSKLSFEWACPKITDGTLNPRHCHAAVYLPLGPTFGGERLIVHGGAGNGFVFGDTHALVCKDTSAMLWERLEVSV